MFFSQPLQMFNESTVHKKINKKAFMSEKYKFLYDLSSTIMNKFSKNKKIISH